MDIEELKNVLSNTSDFPLLIKISLPSLEEEITVDSNTNAIRTYQLLAETTVYLAEEYGKIIGQEMEKENFLKYMDAMYGISKGKKG
ncbi:hypothetical protein [Enterococcus sp. DIV1059_2]|uniref:hypothetical protein n=1 Tax=Enterococcus sp. DIV1059_2 TaxID=2774664 RepID=UPI003F28B39B